MAFGERMERLSFLRRTQMRIPCNSNASYSFHFTGYTSPPPTVCRLCCVHWIWRQDNRAWNISRTEKERWIYCSPQYFSEQTSPDATVEQDSPHSVSSTFSNEGSSKQEYNVSVNTTNEEETEDFAHTKLIRVYRFYIKAVGSLLCLAYLVLGMIYAFLYTFPCEYAQCVYEYFGTDMFRYLGEIVVRWEPDQPWQSSGILHGHLCNASGHVPHILGSGSLVSFYYIPICTIANDLSRHGVINVVSYGGRSLHWSLLSTAL